MTEEKTVDLKLVINLLIYLCSLLIIILLLILLIYKIKKSDVRALLTEPFGSHEEELCQNNRIPPPPPLPRLLSTVLISKEAHNEPLLNDVNEPEQEKGYENENFDTKTSEEKICVNVIINPQTEWIKEIQQNELFNKVKQKIEEK